MHDVRKLSLNAFLIYVQLYPLRLIKIIREPIAPNAAASVGVKIPPYMPPITRRNRVSIPQTPLRLANFSDQVNLGPGGPDQIPNPVKAIITIEYSMASSKPGTIPAINNLPTDSSVKPP